MQPYQRTDKAIDLLNKKAIKRFEQAKARAARFGFDELNVISVTEQLYSDLEQDNERIFMELAEEQYSEIAPEEEDKPDHKWLLALLLAYNPITKYVYEHEVERKQARTAEAINSTNAKATEFRRGLSFWAQMTGQYADTITDEATLKAYRDLGVKKVKWNIAEGDRVCKICRARNGKIYPINSVPDKPHYHCRCWLTPVWKEEGT